MLHSEVTDRELSFAHKMSLQTQTDCSLIRHSESKNVTYLKLSRNEVQAAVPLTACCAAA